MLLFINKAKQPNAIFLETIFLNDYLTELSDTVDGFIVWNTIYKTTYTTSTTFSYTGKYFTPQKTGLRVLLI